MAWFLIKWHRKFQQHKATGKALTFAVWYHWVAQTDQLWICSVGSCRYELEGILWVLMLKCCFELERLKWVLIFRVFINWKSIIWVLILTSIFINLRVSIGYSWLRFFFQISFSVGILKEDSFSLKTRWFDVLLTIHTLWYFRCLWLENHLPTACLVLIDVHILCPTSGSELHPDPSCEQGNFWIVNKISHLSSVRGHFQ